MSFSCSGRQPPSFDVRMICGRYHSGSMSYAGGRSHRILVFSFVWYSGLLLQKLPPPGANHAKQPALLLCFPSVYTPLLSLSLRCEVGKIKLACQYIYRRRFLSSPPFFYLVLLWFLFCCDHAVCACAERFTSARICGAPEAHLAWQDTWKTCTSSGTTSGGVSEVRGEGTWAVVVRTSGKKRKRCR